MAANPNQLGFELNMIKCIGCRACEGACKQQNNVEAGARWRRVTTFRGGTYPDPFTNFLSLSCNHCEKPACAEACPVDAITKRASDGIVILDSNICNGCKRCMEACPYGAPQYNPVTKKVEKCHMCYERIDNGLPPACVETCMARVLKHGVLSTLTGDNGKSVANFASPKYTHPSIRITPPDRQ
ncbi:anaerobic dimethyl sulfoxide reductase chain B [bacterium BMS3Abin01]|nr:anaerobic dimethyl sulfoxide reductase chain B [bacterium BMS3Abin01]HDY69460.1 4Fe-4S dicluster domain-containing protein [Actinomycetota bacterium]